MREPFERGNVVNTALDTFIDKLEGIQSVEAGRKLVCATLSDLGFDRFAYLGLHLPDTALVKPVLLHSYDQEWQERYTDCDYATVDPVVEKGLASLVPFAWGGNKHRKVMGNSSRKMMDEASEFGIIRGFTVPIHGANGELAALSIALPEKADEARKRISAFRHEIHMIGLYFHAHLGEKIFAEGQKNKLLLSQRESECLLWVAQGKTAWETSEILVISDHSVREYIKSACRKLGVYSKNHAIVKAIMLGLIKPNI
ncbi:MAG: hypothetical protein COB46_09060 [Rhodospirillaceae bacterium]|nr:MAG: hypothetical protein COB46_09060 [Rhodospirillaceae bacterium]